MPSDKVVMIVSIILLWIPFYIVAAGVHEAGHVVFGLMQGFKFHLLVIGPFGLKRGENGKVTPYIEKNKAYWGGISATAPVNEDTGNYRKFSNMLIGGPLFSILFGLVFLLSGMFLRNYYILIFGLMCFGMGVTCLIPVKNGAFYTDGRRWLQMRKNAKTRDVEIAILNIAICAVIHGNLAKANVMDINILKSSEDFRTKYIGHYYAYVYYKDLCEYAQADIEKRTIEDMRSKDLVSKQVIKMLTID